jgi:hypothetical protein
MERFRAMCYPYIGNDLYSSSSPPGQGIIKHLISSTSGGNAPTTVCIHPKYRAAM